MAIGAYKNGPFLRWVGGKSWFIKYLPTIIGNLEYNNYHEPFLGSGAVFFALSPLKKSFLSDLNVELINTYISVRDEKELVIKRMRQFKNDEQSYYKIRKYNPYTSANKAARFIYLNQTSYNGVYRVNLKGKYNVPYGFRDVEFLNIDAINSASKVLKNAEIVPGDFEGQISKISKNDLVFLDPPYTVSHNDNGFIKYNQKLFSLEDQNRLSRYIDMIIEKEAFYILTNAAHPKIKEIFCQGRRIELTRASLIGGKNAQRKNVREYIFTNIGGAVDGC